MPLSKDTKGGGTNADGTLSTEYCSFCYVNGQFTLEGPMQTYRETLYKNMTEKKHPLWIRLIMWYQVPTLKRWKQK